MGLIYRKSKMRLNFMEGKPTVYKVQKITLPKVTYQDLVKDVAHAEGVNDTRALAVVRGFLNRMEVFLGMGHAISLGEFGSFSPNLQCKCAKTAEEVTAGTVKKKYIRFIPGARLRDVIKNISITEIESLSEE